MDFTEATDRLTNCATHWDIAKALRVPVQSVRQACMDSESDGSARPPADWPEALARLAREKGGELERLAKELEGRTE